MQGGIIKISQVALLVNMVRMVVGALPLYSPAQHTQPPLKKLHPAEQNETDNPLYLLELGHVQ